MEFIVIENVVMLFLIKGLSVKVVNEKVFNMFDKVGLFYCCEYKLLVLLGGER